MAAKNVSACSFTEGDFVLWSRVDTQLLRNKLMVRWLGLFRVVEALSRSFIVEHLITKARHDVHDKELPLHAVLAGVDDKKRQWVRERGISSEDPSVLMHCLPYLTKYLERKQITGIQLREQDQLKMMWCALDEEAAEEIKVLVEDNVNVCASDEVRYMDCCGGTYGKTALHEAARNGMVDVVSLLLDRGADMNASDNYCWTVLHVAAKSGSVDVVSLLLDRGADMNAVDNVRVDRKM
ncbi:hypothetical protein PHMEG_00013080 [Phytophthora megakarya]|uniref:Uncharacterized protein n=1 Tax=Phytophthora megakarya TaxID=4795 RepID=A0A225W851_9STRA|nr:hypothetical protein PHMEG_00013080 [Phytophthora megakarya]